MKIIIKTAYLPPDASDEELGQAVLEAMSYCANAGLKHIVKEHVTDFANVGISEAQIPSVVMRAVSEGNIVGYQGRGTGRPTYEVMVNGKSKLLAITTGSNGFIVGANPVGRAP